MIQIHLTYESTDINLQAGGYTVLDGFYPQTATDLDQHVTEEIEVLLQAATSAARAALLRALSQVFDHARRHPSDQNYAYLEFGIDESADLTGRRSMPVQ